MKTQVAVMTGPGDLRDQHWLDAQIESIEVGVEAVVNIARNWTEGRNLSRLHPGVSAAQYVTDRVGVLGKAVVPVLLAESNWSNRQIAAVAGVDQSTVHRARVASATPDYTPRPVLGADGKTYAPRVVEAVVIDEPIDDLPMPVPPTRPLVRNVARAFEHELRRIRDDYRELESDPRSLKYRQVFAAMNAVLD